MNKDFRTTVAEEMLRHIEAGTARWQKGWDPGAVRVGPFNPSTQASYRGINSWWLDLQGHADPRWMTYRQAQAVDAQVRKGERGTLVEYWQWSEEQKDQDGNKIEVRLARPKVFMARVFNAEQIDGLEPYQAPGEPFLPVASAELVLQNGGVSIHHDGRGPYYQPSSDSIHMPQAAAFNSAYEYYATALHELGHATGHSSRLHRQFGPFGSLAYGVEELRAEMASYALTTELGLGHYPESHAGYVESWMTAIRADKNVLFRAARDAELICTWISEPEKRQELARLAFERSQGQQVGVALDRSDEHTLTQEPQEEKAMTAEPSEKARRVYLAVPFDEKDRAKAAGAHWDRRAKSWYVNEGTDMASFAAWSEHKPTPAKLSPSEEFAAALKAHGLQIEGDPAMDGKWHRVAIEGDRKGQMSGSYRGFLDGVPSGTIVNFKRGEPIKWVATGIAIDPAERDRLKAESEQRRLAQEEEQKKLRHKTAKKAFGVWEHAREVGTSGYFEAKGIEDHPSKFGLKLDEKGNVLVPMRDGRGFLWNLQVIAPDGQKRFLTGGRKSGLMHMMGRKGDLEKPEAAIIVAEGMATAIRLRQSVEPPASVAVAFDAGNLEEVAKGLRKQYPSSRIFIAADDDHKLLKQPPYLNVGLEKAAAAAEAVKGTVIKPPLTARDRENGLTDFDDVARASGLEAVAKAVRKAMKQDQGVVKVKKPRSAQLDHDAGLEASL